MYSPLLEKQGDQSPASSADHHVRDCCKMHELISRRAWVESQTWTVNVCQKINERQIIHLRHRGSSVNGPLPSVLHLLNRVGTEHHDSEQCFTTRRGTSRFVATLHDSVEHFTTRWSTSRLGGALYDSVQHYTNGATLHDTVQQSNTVQHLTSRCSFSRLGAELHD